MKKGYAFYSRNNSYSRSFNAELAEQEGRLPLTRCAHFFGINPKLFKEALRLENLTTSEWHHVGKYAARVEYWDTNFLKRNKRLWERINMLAGDRTKAKIIAKNILNQLEVF